MEKLAVSVTEAAHLLGISRASIYPRLLSGEIPSVTLGARRLVPVQALKAWLDAQETQGGQS